MENLAALLNDAWFWIVWGNNQLRIIAEYATFGTLLIVAGNWWMWWYSWWPVTIIAVNDDSARTPKENKEVGALPRRSVTRAEVMGFVGQAAGGETLVFKHFKFDYQFKNQILVSLPEPSYRAVTGAGPSRGAAAVA